MTTPTAVGSAALDTAGPSSAAALSHAAVLALPSGVLVAYTKNTAGTVTDHLALLGTDLTPLVSMSRPSTITVGDIRAAAHHLIQTGATSAAWVVDDASQPNGTSATVEAGAGLTVGPPVAATVRLVDHLAAPLRLDGRTVVATTEGIQVWHDAGGATSHSLPGVYPTALHPGSTPDTVLVSSSDGPPSLVEVDLTTGASSVVATAPAAPYWAGVAAPDRAGWRWMFDQYDNQWAMTLTGADPHIPGDGIEAQGRFGGIHTPVGVVALPWLDQYAAPETGCGAVYLAAQDGSPLQVAYLTTPHQGQVWGAGLGTRTLAASVRDGSLIIVGAYYQQTGPTVSDRQWYLHAWAVDLGATYDGILHIDTIDAPHWLVGARDPGMDYRLHIDTGTERLVEILAGQDDQATYRLRVCDGQDWPVAAYLRPDA